jgi:hypothetical protein
MTRTAARPSLLAVAVTCMALAGCNDDGAVSPSGDETSGASAATDSGGDALDLAASDEPTDHHLDALVGGVVDVDERGCVVLVASGEVSHTYWPFGTRPVDADTLELADGRRIDVGDEITAGGGYVSRLVAQHRCLAYDGTTVIISGINEIE